MIFTLNPSAAHILKVGSVGSGLTGIKVKSSQPITAFLTSDENAIYLEQNNSPNPQYSVQMILQKAYKAETNIVISDSYKNMVLVNQNPVPAIVELEFEDLNKINPSTFSFPTSGAGTTGMGF